MKNARAGNVSRSPGALRALLLLLLLPGTGWAQKPGATADVSRFVLEAAERYQKGDLEGAVAAYRRAIAVSPNDGVLYFNLGRMLADSDKLPEAAAAYEQAVTLLEK